MVWKKIGVVGVDSGQLLICDPCYIDSEWEKEDFDMPDEIAIFPDGKEEVLQRCSPRWFELVNDINSGKIKLKNKGTIKEAKNNFSYNACCQKDMFKQLNYKIGHEGVGVVFESGLGDGCYEVWAYIKKVGMFGERITEVKIKLI